MLTDQQILDNKKRFIELLDSIKIEGSNIEGLKEYLEKSDFYEAPASGQFHGSFKGGLCLHSLNVYDSIVKLANTFCPGKYEEDSLKVVALLHDLAKVNFYEGYVRNKKVYSEDGSKKDNMGKFDWFAEQAYKVKEAKDRFLCGGHATNSFVIVSQYIPLTGEEIAAIVNHHGGFNVAPQDYDLSNIFNRYSLAVLLHTSDTLATYILEQIKEK